MSFSFIWAGSEAPQANQAEQEALDNYSPENALDHDLTFLKYTNLFMCFGDGGTMKK